MIVRRKIVFVDTETTGLDPTRDRIVSYCAVVWHGPGKYGPPLSRFVDPQCDVEDRVRQVNGYDADVWRTQHNATPYDKSDVANLAVMFNDATVAGSNPRFDMGFIASEANRLGIGPPAWSHRVIDLASLAAPLWLAGVVEGIGLQNSIKLFGVNPGVEHTAIDDCYASIAVWERYLELYLGATWETDE
jgi:DNA polymerase-3 subunit epsilon